MKKEIPESYACCWLHTINNDRYVGRVAECTFTGNTLKIGVAPIVGVENDPSARGWHPTTLQPRCSFEFDGCNVVKQHSPHKREFLSRLGDRIILSSDEVDKGIIESLIEEITFQETRPSV